MEAYEDRHVIPGQVYVANGKRMLRNRYTYTVTSVIQRLTDGAIIVHYRCNEWTAFKSDMEIDEFVTRFEECE